MMTTVLSVIFYLYHKKNSINFSFFAFTVLILSMMASMLDSLVFYIIEPKNFLDSVIAINISMEVMLIVVIMLGYISTKKQFKHNNRHDIAVDIMMVWNEISMALFLYALIYPPNKVSSLYIIQMTSGGLGFYFFIIPMLVEMIFLFLIAGENIRKIKMGVLLIASFLPPTFLGNTPYTQYFVIVQVMSMSIAITLLLWLGIVKMELKEQFMREFWIVIVIIAAMLSATLTGISNFAGFFISWLPYGGVTITSMVYYFYLALERREL